MEYLVQLEEEGGSFGSAYQLTIVLLGKACPLYIIEGLPMKVASTVRSLGCGFPLNSITVGSQACMFEFLGSFVN